jgi:hypothetical protein
MVSRALRLSSPSNSISTGVGVRCRAESAAALRPPRSVSCSSAYSSLLSWNRSNASCVKNIAYASDWLLPPCAMARRPSRLLRQSMALPPRIQRAEPSLKPLCVRFIAGCEPSARTRPTSPGAIPGTE